MTAASSLPPQPPRAGIGEPLRRLEDARLLTGRGCYSDDFNLAGQVYAVMVRSPHAHVRITAIDTEHARATPGALAVLTGTDYVADGLGPMTYSPAARTPPDIRLEHLDRVPASASRQYPLAVERARFAGEAVAFVVAETLAAAKDAAEVVRVDYTPLAAVTSSAAAAFEDAPSLLDENRPNLVLDAGAGDHEASERAFTAATHIARLSTWVQRVTGVPMEPRAALAEFDPASGRITLYAGGGSIGRPRQDVSAMLGLPQDKVRVIARDVGGNFGTRNSSYPEFSLVAWAARRLGRPVKWTGERQEAFLSDHQARDLRVEAELALDAEGNFLALRAANLSNLGAYAASSTRCRLRTCFMLDSVGFFASLANRSMLAARMPSPRQIAFWDKVLVPVSRVLDNVTGHKFGKSIVAVWAPL